MVPTARCSTSQRGGRTRKREEERVLHLFPMLPTAHRLGRRTCPLPSSHFPLPCAPQFRNLDSTLRQRLYIGFKRRGEVGAPDSRRDFPPRLHLPGNGKRIAGGAHHRADMVAHVEVIQQLESR